MKRTKLSKKLRRLTVRSLAFVISLTVILSMVTVLGLVSFAADEEQMILLSADTESNDIIIPIPKSTLTNNEYYKLTFKAKVLKGSKPIIGYFNVKNTSKNATAKYAFQAKPENVNNGILDGTPDMIGADPKLYSKYDDTNNEFTAIIKIEQVTDTSNYAADPDHDEIAGLLTIGNTEYGEGGEKDSELEFVFARPKLEHMVKVDGVWTAETDNAIELPELKTSNIDISKAYAYYDCSDTAGISRKKIKENETIGDKIKFICAPKNKYSTLANDLTKITLIDYNDSLSTAVGHNFTYVEEKEPTSESTGMKAYYTCDCGECDGKYYASESENSLIEDINTYIIPVTTNKIIVSEKKNSVSNIAVPLEIKKAVGKLADPTVVTGGNDDYDVYLKLKFKARMFSGEKPVIGVIGKTAEGIATTYKANANNLNETSEEGLFCNYNADTLEYTAVIKTSVKSAVNGRDFVLTIGNAEHDGKDGFDTQDYDVSFAITDPELYILDPTTKLAIDETNNILSKITDYNTIFEEENKITSVQGLLNAKAKSYVRDGANNSVLQADPIDNFFDPNHKFAYEEKQEPTEDNDGRRAYYYCKDCTVENCCFAGKKYLDKGYTEVDDAGLVIKKFQMITISRDNNTNVFVPLDLSEYVTEKHLGEGKTGGSVYVKLTFDAKMIEGEKPIVSRIRGSSDKGGDYSYSEPDYADNTNETPAPAGQEPVLYSKFDKHTGEYEAVLKLQVGVGYSTLSNGVHDAILIGHSEHNGAGYKESDTSISFSFRNPQLYLMDIATGEVDYSTGNLLPSISEGNLNFDTNYVHNSDNPCKASNHILSAPKNMWSIDGSPSNVAVEDITTGYFEYVEFTYHPQEDPTPIQEGTKAYYTCDDPTKTSYYGKKYWDKGITEITDPDNELKITYAKMITIKSGSRSNVFIPLNLTKYSAYKKYKDASGYSYVRLTFKARMLKGDKPVVSRIRGDITNGEGSHAEPNYVDNLDNVYDGIESKNNEGTVTGPDLYCYFNEDTGIYTAIIRLGVGVSWSTLSNGVHDAILIGNAEHNGPSFTSESDTNVSFSFTQPELYFVDAATGIVDKSTGNLMPPICEENLNKSDIEGQLNAYNYKGDPYTGSDHILSAPVNKWSTDGDAKYVEYNNIEEKYFDYRFKKVEAKEPTTTEEGHKAYYECKCDDPLCKYVGKKFSDKGMTEVTDDDIKLGKIKMITVKAGSNDNVYIPLNISDSLKDRYKDAGGYSYLMLKFKARMYTGVKPVVSRVRGDLSKKDSDNNPIEGSHAEKNYVDNDDNEYNGVESKDNEGKVTGPDLYCKYDDVTNTYTAVIRLGVGVSWATLANGVHDAILIGHSEHNGPSFTSETDQAVSFSFTQPELYFINIKGDISTEEKLFNAVDKSTGNLIMPICDETNNLSEAYEYTGDPTISARHLLKAPQDKWSIDGKNTNGIYMDNIPNDKYFTHHFVYTPEVRPTITSPGQRAYYTCDCGALDCEYAGKKYSDKGITELTDITLGKSKMITIGTGSNDNAYIPLNLKNSLKDKYKDAGGYSYLMLKFKARMYTGVKPVVSRVRGDLSKKDSDNKPIEGSHAEKNYVDNNDDTYDGVEVKDRDKQGNVIATGPDLYCKYDEIKNEYTAVIRLGVGVGWATLANGVHDAILIGHSEHNGPSFTSETDQTASFSFADPELYFIDIKGDISTEEKLLAAVDTSTGNLIAPICDETNNLSEAYEYTGDPTISARHLLKAPQDKWSIDGKNTNGIYMDDVPNDKYFTHHFVYTPEIRPTPNSAGQRAYYECVCGAADCEYAGKMYSDKGITEITDITLGKTKMILFGTNSKISNVFVPLSLKTVVQDKHKDGGGYSYVKLKFKTRILGGSYPIVSRIRGSSDLGGDYSYSEPGYADNSDHTYDGIENKNDSGSVKGPDLYTDYNPDTMIFTAIIRISASSAYTTLSNGVHDAILIGNAEHNGNSTSESDYANSFIFAEPELYLLKLNGSTAEEDLAIGNLMPPICDENINTEKTYAHNNVENIKSGKYTYNPCTLENHVLSAPKDMWSVDGDNSSISYYEIPDGYFESTGEKANKLTIRDGATDSIISTTAKLLPATNYKVDIDYNTKNGGKLVVKYMMLNGSDEYVNAEDLGVTFDKTIDNVEGKHYGAVFTMPASGLLGTTGDNFKLIIGATGGEVEFTNVKVRPISISGVYGQNALLNGDFRRSYASSGSFGKIFPFWNEENAAEASKITSEKGIETGDFANTTPVAIYAKNTTGTFTTDVSLKPNTEYVLKFGSKYESDETAKPYVALKTASGVITAIGKYSTDVDGLHNTVYKFKTPSDLLGGLNATVGVNIDSKSIIASFSGFEIYELSELGIEQGENYISDPYLLSLGTASSIWKESDSLNVTHKPISIYHFKILESKVLVFSGRNGMDSPVGADGNVVYAGNSNGYIETFATIEKGKQYIFSLNYKFAGEGYNLGEAKKGPELLVNTADGYVALVANKTVSNDEYKETYIFTAPDGLSESSNNFRFRFNVPGAMTSGYLANVSLRQYNGTKAEGEELIENGNFSTGDISGWSRSSSSHFYQFKFAQIPKNFFSKTNPNKPSMIIFRDSTDYAQFMQHLMVKPSTNYEIEYKIRHSAQKYADKPAHFTIYMNEYTKKDDGSGFVIKADGRNVDATSMSMPSVYKATEQEIEKYADTTRRTYHSTADDSYKEKYRQILRFTTSKNIRTTGDGNILIRLYMRTGTAGFFGDVKLYELDENGNRIGNNLILNGDFSLGTTAWDTTGDFTARTVEQPDGFFANDYIDTPKTMVYSNGSASNQTYGNTFKLKKGATYYFSGNYVNMNSQGLTPEIKYRSITGEFKILKTDLYYSADSYYFEIKFQLPDDALFIDGFAEVQVYITNNDGGKGYFHSLRLTEGSSYKNLFDDVGFVGQNGNYIVMDYDPNVFVFYYDDTKFNDGDWSGEAELTDSDAKGVVLDEDRNGISGIKMILDPGDKTSETDDNGNYSFKGLKPGTYSLYLVSPKTGNKIFCLSFDVEESKSITLPFIIYSNAKIEEDEDKYEYDDKKEVVEVIGEVESKSRSVIQCLLFDEEGNRLSDIPIFIDDNGYAITNKKGIATFDNLQNFGAKKIYIYLDNGEKYIFRKVNVVEGKGTRIKLMFAPDSDNTLLYILIFGGAGLLLVAGAAVTVILLLKKKASVVSP